MTNKETAMEAANVLNDKKGIDVVVINVTDISSYTDYFVIATGNNERQVGSLVDDVDDHLSKKGVFPKHIEGKPDSGWVLMDYGDVIVNVFSREQRKNYIFDQLWMDCEKIYISDSDE